MNTQGKTDLRVQKTLEAIKKTFKQMICEMDARDIQIKELAERARINRKTFYLHYDSLEALYQDIMQELAGGYIEQLEADGQPPSLMEFNRVFFQSMAGQEPYVERLICEPGYRDFCDRIFHSVFRHNHAAYNPFSKFTDSEQALIYVLISASPLDIYRQWVADGKKVPVERVAELTNAMISGAMSALEKMTPIDEERELPLQRRQHCRP
ncbi:MAG: TetR/AcrR family transcriptional regulator [Lachnospiraceae bacterium]|nr:TetR/AcrR family transcriptional regulator [Lachnospiraceae bacterium]